MRVFVCQRLDIYFEPDADRWSWEDMDNVVEFVQDQVVKDPWHRFYDLSETIFAFHLSRNDQDACDEFENALNELLRRNFCGYQMRNGEIERIGAKASEQVIAEARGILRDDRLAGPNDQFMKAVGFLSHRPKPDAENCSKEALGAVEGMSRIALGKPKILLSDALKQMNKDGKLPPTLQKAVDGLYAFRGDAGGVGHGQTGPSTVTLEQAEFVLHCSAAAIVYIARSYGYAVL
jgi:hypothetical protein